MLSSRVVITMLLHLLKVNGVLHLSNTGELFYSAYTRYDFTLVQVVSHRPTERSLYRITRLVLTLVTHHPHPHLRDMHHPHLNNTINSIIKEDTGVVIIVNMEDMHHRPVNLLHLSISPPEQDTDRRIRLLKDNTLPLAKLQVCLQSSSCSRSGSVIHADPSETAYFSTTIRSTVSRSRRTTKQTFLPVLSMYW